MAGRGLVTGFRVGATHRLAKEVQDPPPELLRRKSERGGVKRTGTTHNDFGPRAAVGKRSVGFTDETRRQRPAHGVEKRGRGQPAHGCGQYRRQQQKDQQNPEQAARHRASEEDTRFPGKVFRKVWPCLLRLTRKKKRISCGKGRLRAGTFLRPGRARRRRRRRWKGKSAR